jgi:hypothetical protein
MSVAGALAVFTQERAAVTSLINQRLARPPPPPAGEQREPVAAYANAPMIISH